MYFGSPTPFSFSHTPKKTKSLYKTKPSEYIGHLIGHEGEGSVLSLLRHKRWATGISAGISGSGFNSSSCCATFSVTFYLTKAREHDD